MQHVVRRARAVLAAAMVATSVVAGSAFADEPTAEQMDLAKKVLIAVGLKASIDQIVPAMLSQLQAQLLQIHPEMGKTLHETLVALEPEFNKDEDSVFTDTARPLAKALTVAELQQTLTYFESQAGKKYTLAQTGVLDALSASGGDWRQRLTKVMLDRTRSEMKKKGFTF
jgi:uncharacterized protein